MPASPPKDKDKDTGGLAIPIVPIARKASSAASSSTLQIPGRNASPSVGTIQQRHSSVGQYHNRGKYGSIGRLAAMAKSYYDPCRLAFDQMAKMSVRDVKKEAIRNKRVLMRADLDVPMENGRIANNHKIVKALPTIRYLIEKRAKAVIIISHLGHPGGRPDVNLSMKPVLAELQNLLGRKVTFLEDCCGPKVEKFCLDPEPGSVILLENLRFHIEEEIEGYDAVNKKKIHAEKPQVEAFRKSLSSLGDIFVNDAFAVANKMHSSIVGIDIDIRTGGLLMQKELDFFREALSEIDTPKPFLVIMCGRRVANSMECMKTLLENRVTDIMIAGGMEYTFNKILHGMKIGESVFDSEGGKHIPEFMSKAKEKGVNIHIPCDFITAPEISDEVNCLTATLESGILEGYHGLDIGFKTNEEFQDVVAEAKTILWYGVPGMYELESFGFGSKQIMDSVVRATRNGATSIISGGYTAMCAKKYNATEHISHVSTANKEVIRSLMKGQALAGVKYLNNIGIKSPESKSRRSSGFTYPKR